MKAFKFTCIPLWATCVVMVVAAMPAQAAVEARQPVASYSVAPNPIAPSGSLGTSGAVQLTLIALDATGKPISGGLVWLLLLSVMPDGHVRPDGMGDLRVNATPVKVSYPSYLYRADSAGRLDLTYTATTNGTPRYTDLIWAHRNYRQLLGTAPGATDTYTY